MPSGWGWQVIASVQKEEDECEEGTPHEPLMGIIK